MNRNYYFLILILCSFLLTWILYRSYQFDNIFAIIFYSILGFIWVCMFYIIVSGDISIYKQKHRVSTYWKTILCLLSLIPMLIVYQFYNSKISVPNLIKAQRHGVYAYFKKDGTYFIRSGVWGSKKHFYGSYKIKDSIIILDRSNLDEVLVSNTLVIRHSNLEYEKTRPDYDRIETDKYLVQLDSNGKEIIARCISINNNGIEDCMPYKFEVVGSTH
jgi:hypothetical protein